MGILDLNDIRDFEDQNFGKRSMIDSEAWQNIRYPLKRFVEQRIPFRGKKRNFESDDQNTKVHYGRRNFESDDQNVWGKRSKIQNIRSESQNFGRK